MQKKSMRGQAVAGRGKETFFMKRGIVGSISATAILGLWTLLFPYASHAQSSSEPPGQPAEQAQSQQTFSDQDLQACAKAFVEIEKIHVKHQAALDSGQEPAQAQQTQHEANTEMIKAIEKEGLTAQTYNQILLTAQNDPALAQKLNQLIAQEKAS